MLVIIFPFLTSFYYISFMIISKSHRTAVYVDQIKWLLTIMAMEKIRRETNFLQFSFNLYWCIHIHNRAMYALDINDMFYCFLLSTFRFLRSHSFPTCDVVSQRALCVCWSYLMLMSHKNSRTWKFNYVQDGFSAILNRNFHFIWNWIYITFQFSITHSI